MGLGSSVQHLPVWMRSRSLAAANCWVPMFGQRPGPRGNAGQRPILGGPVQLMTAPFLERSFGRLHHFCWPSSPLSDEDPPCCLFQVALMELSITVPCSTPGPWGKCISQIWPVSSVAPDDSDWPREWTCDSGRANQSPSQRFSSESVFSVEKKV